MLDAADELLQREGDEPPSMDAIARAAGVGKGTLFRAFGDRDGLLDALTLVKFESLRDAAGDPGSPIGPDVPARERAVAFLDALLMFKVDNRTLMHAREGRGGGDLRSAYYAWMRAFLHDRIIEALPGVGAQEAAYLAHALLAATRIDLVDALLREGQAVEDVRREHAKHALAMLTRRDPPR